MKSDNKIIHLIGSHLSYDISEEREKNYIGKRIAEARQSKKLSLAAFCALLSQCGIDIGTAALSKWELGKSVPSAYQLFAVAHILGLEDNMGYFFEERRTLNDEGMEKLLSYKNDLIATGMYKPHPPKRQIRMVSMPVSELRVSAGTGNFLDEGQFRNIKFPEDQIPFGANFGLYIHGDSMEPVYQDGQLVWVKECSELRPGEVGIFIYDGCGYIKCYDVQEPDETVADEYEDSYGNTHFQSVLISYNEAYSPIVVSPNTMFSIIGKVL